MVHTTETAQRICKKQAGELEEQIQAIKDNHTTVETKTLLEKFDKELVTFKENTINFKSAKFEKDKKIFSVETVYPYLKDDFYTKVESRRVLSDYQGRSKDIFLTFSETSPSDSTGNCDPGEGSSNRNQQRQNSFFKKRTAKKQGALQTTTMGKENKAPVLQNIIPSSIVNLSNKELNKEEESVLELGLKFVPSKRTDFTRLKIEAIEFFCKIRLKAFFSTKESKNSSEPSGLANKSKFKPPTHTIQKEIIAFEQVVLSSIQQLDRKKIFSTNKLEINYNSFIIFLVLDYTQS